MSPLASSLDSTPAVSQNQLPGMSHESVVTDSLSVRRPWDEVVVRVSSKRSSPLCFESSRVTTKENSAIPYAKNVSANPFPTPYVSKTWSPFSYLCDENSSAAFACVFHRNRDASPQSGEWFRESAHGTRAIPRDVRAGLLVVLLVVLLVTVVPASESWSVSSMK